MILPILVTVLTLVILASLHEFGHFALAKKFGVKVEEFGIGYPPRVFGKKVGETVYSLNLLPFGAFVRIHGEDQFSDSSKEKEILGIENSPGFQDKPIWQRAAITLGGVISFWIIGAILFTVVFSMGTPVAISDDVEITNAKVQIVEIAPNSPAETSGLKIGDTIIELQDSDHKIQDIDKIKEIQEFTEKNKEKEVTLTIIRGNEHLNISLTPRAVHPKNEGAMGVALARTTVEKYPPYLAFPKGVKTCLGLTLEIILGLFQVIKDITLGQETPSGVGVVGPVGIGSLIFQSFQMGLVYFLQFLAVLSTYLALFNLLPIPAVDGGKLLFLGIEKIKGRPINRKLEMKINTLFFTLIILIMVFVTINDIERLF